MNFNEVIFIFLNRQKMNDPKTHGLSRHSGHTMGHTDSRANVMTRHQKQH